MIRKDVVIAVLATFCLTSTLFMITTSKSQSGVGEYNPWADYNGDGTIDIFDIVPVAVSFGATGDSTKNVNVTNWPEQYKTGSVWVKITWLEGGGYGFTWNGSSQVDTRSFSKISFYVEPLDMSIEGYWGPSVLAINISYVDWWNTEAMITEGVDPDLSYGIYGHSGTGWAHWLMSARLFEVKGPFCNFGLTPNWIGEPPSPTGWITLNVRYYLRND